MIVGCCLLIVGGCLLPVGRVHAASPKGVTVSPIVQTISLPAVVSSEQTQFTVSNNTPATITLQLKLVDFSTLDESGGVLFGGTNESQLTKKYGLTKWANLDQSSIALDPQQTRTVTATLLNPPDLPPGGHYGAVLFQLSGATENGAASKVSLNQVVSSLLFVAKVGGERFGLTLQKPPTRLYWSALPTSIDLRFYNSGNMHATPRGTVTVTNPLGKVAASGVINEQSGIILPETNRKYSTALMKRLNSLVPGIYTVRIKYRYDGRDSFSNLSYTFMVLNLFAVIVLAIVALLVAWMVWKRRYLWAQLKRGRALIPTP